MKQLFLIIVLLSVSSNSFAQPSELQTIDIIYMKDGRVLRGEILSFEEKDGDITFVDTYGRKYSITREEYKYFEENQLVKVKGSKRDTVMLDRKEDQFEFSVGLSWGWYNPSSTFTADDYYLSNFNNNSFYPINLHAGFGKYFSRKHFVGLNAEFSIISIASPVVNVNARYAYQYDAYKKNVASYIPLEFGFHNLTNSTSFFVDDTLEITDVSWTNQLNVDVKTNALNVGIGHGFNFMMKNTRSFAIELLIYKYFILNERFENLSNGTPNFKSSPIGGKFAFYVNI